MSKKVIVVLQHLEGVAAFASLEFKPLAADRNSRNSWSTPVSSIISQSKDFEIQSKFKVCLLLCLSLLTTSKGKDTAASKQGEEQTSKVQNKERTSCGEGGLYWETVSAAVSPPPRTPNRLISTMVDILQPCVQNPSGRFTTHRIKSENIFGLL